MPTVQPEEEEDRRTEVQRDVGEAEKVHQARNRRGRALDAGLPEEVELLLELRDVPCVTRCCVDTAGYEAAPSLVDEVERGDEGDLDLATVGPAEPVREQRCRAANRLTGARDLEPIPDQQRLDSSSSGARILTASRGGQPRSTRSRRA